MCLYCGGLGSTGDGFHLHKCHYCKGTGCNQSAPFRAMVLCADCNGLGFTDELCRPCNGSGEGMTADNTCKACEGLGVEMSACEKCKGTGETEKENIE